MGYDHWGLSPAKIGLPATELWFARTADTRRTLEALAAATLVFLLAALMSGLRATEFNNYAYLADAFAHGRVWVESPPAYLSFVPYQGRDYVIEPPLPALLLLPFALLYHVAVNQTLLSVTLLALGTAACWRFLQRIGLRRVDTGFLTAIMLFATSYFYAGMSGDVWQLASVSAITCTFLLFDEVAGRNRPWLVATFAVAAGLSRYTLFPLAAIYGLIGARHFGSAYGRSYYFVLERAIIAFAAYNLARWGTVYDRGYRLYETVYTHMQKPMFALDNVGYQLHYIFLQPLHAVPHFPFFVPDDFGFGVLFSGTVFVATLFAPVSRASVALWVMLGLAMLPDLLYYDSGDEQFGSRHTLDFAPFALALLALFVRAHARSRMLIPVYCVGAVNAICGLLWLNAFRATFDH